MPKHSKFTDCNDSAARITSDPEASEIRKRPCAVFGCHKVARHKQTRRFIVGTAIRIGFYATCGEHKNGRTR